MTMAESWTWSQAHNDYYRCAYENGTLVYHWAKAQPEHALRSVEKPSEDLRLMAPSTSSANTIASKSKNPTVTLLAKDCLKSFEKMCEDLQSQNQETHDLILRVSNELDRFRLWMISFDIESGVLDEQPLSLATLQLLRSQLSSISKLLRQYSTSIKDHMNLEQHDHYITHIRHAISSILELSPVLEVAIDGIVTGNEDAIELDASVTAESIQLASSGEPSLIPSYQIERGKADTDSFVIDECVERDWVARFHNISNKTAGTASSVSSYSRSSQIASTALTSRTGSPDQGHAGSFREGLPLWAFRGTPDGTEVLDPEYRVQNAQFFKEGKVSKTKIYELSTD